MEEGDGGFEAGEAGVGGDDFGGEGAGGGGGAVEGEAVAGGACTRTMRRPGARAWAFTSSGMTSSDG